MTQKPAAGIERSEPGLLGSQQRQPPQALDLVAAKLSDVGRARPHNEDYVDYYVPSDPDLLSRRGSLFLVADGMGGHQAGEVASRGAVESVIQQYYADPGDDIGLCLVRAFQAANQKLHAQAQQDPTKSGMGTTLVAAVILGRKVVVANVGDSRTYLINGRRIRQITEDHSWVEEQVRAVYITAEQARRHPQRNLVTRALGSKPAVEVDLFEGELTSGDTLLLCSDGLTGRVEDQEISAIVHEHPVEEAARRLVALANERGGNDNITVLLVGAAQEPATLRIPPKAQPDRRMSRSWILVAGLAVVLLVLGGVAGARLLLPDKATPTPSPTATITEAPAQPTATLAPSEEVTPPQEATLSPALADTPAGPTATLMPTATASATASATPSATPSGTATPTGTLTPTVTITATADLPTTPSNTAEPGGTREALMTAVSTWTVELPTIAVTTPPAPEP